jgi:hypothetical protein
LTIALRRTSIEVLKLTSQTLCKKDHIALFSLIEILLQIPAHHIDKKKNVSSSHALVYGEGA